MPINVINGIFEQASKMTVCLATKAKELLANQPVGSFNMVAPSVAGSEMDENKSRKMSRKASVTELVPSVPRSIFKIEPDLKLLQWEVDELSKEFNGSSIMLSLREEGVFVMLKKADDPAEFTLKVPPDYPSKQAFQRVLNSRLVDLDHMIIGAVTLTSTIRLLHSA